MITRLTVKDCTEAEKIFKQCFSQPWSKSSIETELEGKNNILLGYFENNILLGVTTAEKSDDTTYITNVAVDKACRRRGIASELICALKNECEGKICLDVRVSNTSAIALYKSLGFV